MTPVKTRPPAGSHAEDVLVTTELLREVRQKGHVMVPNTVDGDIDVFFEPAQKMYHVNQYYNGVLVSHPWVFKRDIQGYLIELREKRRAESKKRKRKDTE